MALIFPTIRGPAWEAVRYAGAVLSQAPDELWHSGHWRVEVTDADNVLLFTVITLAVDTPKASDRFSMK